MSFFPRRRPAALRWKVEQRRYRAVAAGSLVAVSLLSGCGGGDSATTVQGKITFDGKPVTTGLINFMPAKGQPLGGEIQPDGSYSYDLPPGDYKVRIDSPPPVPAGLQEGSAVTPAAAPPPPTGKPGQGQVPPQYANFDTSGLTLTVGNESSQEHDFSLP